MTLASRLSSIAAACARRIVSARQRVEFASASRQRSLSRRSRSRSIACLTPSSSAEQAGQLGSRSRKIEALTIDTVQLGAGAGEFGKAVAKHRLEKDRRPEGTAHLIAIGFVQRHRVPLAEAAGSFQDLAEANVVDPLVDQRAKEAAALDDAMAAEGAAAFE